MLLIFILIAITLFLLLLWLITKSNLYLKIAGYFWLALLGLMITGIFVGMLLSQKKLNRDDYTGEYMIDRSYFKGKQADWQYDHFRFEIKENDSIYFYVTDKEHISQTFKGTVSTVKPYQSERLVLHMLLPTHHVLETNPTIYRDTWNFHLVFNSPKFGNMYFIKGKWKP